jgi:competence protein CoiA
MIYANVNGVKTQAAPGLRGTCPGCGGEVLSKTGDIYVWHWAHKSCGDCDSWSEGETEWHLRWKEYWPQDCREITINKGGLIHRADVIRHDGVVVEIQNSPISPEEIIERENFYGRMIWVLNGANFNWEWRGRTNFGGGYKFRWRYRHRSWDYATRPVYIDFQGLEWEDSFYKISPEIAEIGKIYPKGYGWVKETDISEIIVGTPSVPIKLF